MAGAAGSVTISWAARAATSAVMVLVSTGAALLGARSAGLGAEALGAEAAAMPVTLTQHNALMMPLVASGVLLLLFLLFNYIALLVLLYMAFMGAVATGACVHTALALTLSLSPRARLRASAGIAIATVCVSAAYAPRC